MYRFRHALFAGLLTLGVTLSSVADDPPLTCQNTKGINWILPGEFETARSRARQENRILMIKGIAFGIDDVGARNAQKGCW